MRIIDLSVFLKTHKNWYSLCILPVGSVFHAAMEIQKLGGIIKTWMGLAILYKVLLIGTNRNLKS